MRKKLITCVLSVFALASWAGAAEQKPAPAVKPNIVYILVDDMGYGDVHCLNPQHSEIATPHMDRLAAQGIVFTDAHATSSMCTPSKEGK